MTNFKILIINAKENNRVCKPLKPLRIYFRPQDETSALIFFLAHRRSSTIQCASLDEITHPGIMNEEVTKKGLVPINDIVTGEPLPFFIPRYQRGYRWTKTQVEQFCEDIYQTPEGKWNCIQPLVVKVSNGRIEVIDGQQPFISS